MESEASETSEMITTPLHEMETPTATRKPALCFAPMQGLHAAFWRVYHCNLEASTRSRGCIEFTHVSRYNDTSNKYSSDYGTFNIKDTDSSNLSLELSTDGLTYGNDAFLEYTDNTHLYELRVG